MAENDRDRWWIFKIPKISIWWLVWAAMFGGFIYYQYIHVKNSENAEQKNHALLEHGQKNQLENGSGVSQMSHLAKTFGDQSSDDISRRPGASNGIQ